VIQGLVRRLLDAPPDVLGAVPVVDGEPHWTHAVWRQRALEPFELARRDGVRSLRAAAARVPLVLVRGMAPAALADADEPRDLPGDG
jgi:hypothetical protein